MIPKKLGHIWIGPLEAPYAWMNTWPEVHPEWSYRVFDNEYFNSRKWRLRDHMEQYFKMGIYAGVADMMRYEILYEDGGFIAPADSICLSSVDDLFGEDKAYTAYENEIIRGDLMLPFLAAPPQSPAIGAIIEMIARQEPTSMGRPYLSTGNYLVGKVARNYPDHVIILPSYTFAPRHMVGIEYSGSGKVYAQQFFASGKRLYKAKKQGWITGIRQKINGKIQHRYARQAISEAIYMSYNDDDLKSARDSSLST